MAGSSSGLLSYLTKRFLLRFNSGNHLFDVKALCNGFLAGAVSVSVGSGGMQPYYAVLTGVVASPLYIIAILIFRQFTIDDPMENCQIYILPIFWGVMAAVAFQDT